MIKDKKIPIFSMKEMKKMENYISIDLLMVKDLNKLLDKLLDIFTTKGYDVKIPKYMKEIVSGGITRGQFDVGGWICAWREKQLRGDYRIFGYIITFIGFLFTLFSLFWFLNMVLMFSGLSSLFIGYILVVVLAPVFDTTNIWVYITGLSSVGSEMRNITIVEENIVFENICVFSDITIRMCSDSKNTKVDIDSVIEMLKTRYRKNENTS